MLWNAADELSPNPDEFAHLVAGISYWQTGDASLYNVNPPLVRLVAALPSIMGGVRIPQLYVKVDRTTRREFEFGRAFIEEHPRSAFAHLVSARRACLVFVAAGTVAVMLLGGLLVNSQAGLVAGLIWAFNPITLGYSVQLGCDIPAASMGAWALLCSALVIEKPTTKTACIAGICLGLAIVTKSTWIVAATLWPIGFVAIWAYLQGFEWCRSRKTLEKVEKVQSLAPSAAGHFSRLKCYEFASLKLTSVLRIVLLIALTAFGVVVLAYRDQGVFTKLGDFTFVSASLAGDTNVGNRFRGSWADTIPIPLPRSFIEGIDQQWEDFDKPRWAFAFGKWKLGGWWWYYLAALSVKLPLGLMLLLAASLRYAIRDPRLIAIGIVLPIFFIALVSTKTNMNEHCRYVWVILPMLAVMASLAVERSSNRFWMTVNFTLVSWIVCAGLLTYPFGIAYSNELFGGPARTSEHLAASNVDWSQGWVAARKWLELDRNRDRFIGIIEPKWYPLSTVGIETMDDDSMSEEASFASSVPILVMVCIHDRMEIERNSRTAFARAKRIETIAYCIEVYEFPYTERFRLQGAKPYRGTVDGLAF